MSTTEHAAPGGAAFALPDQALITELDVRPILAGGNDPLKQIMLKVNELQDGHWLKIINTFEPLPLINLMRSKGFSSNTDTVQSGLIHTYFFRTEGNTAQGTGKQHTADAAANFNELLEKYKGRMRTIDVREYEMPRPMITILDNLESLNAGEALFVHHKKVPVYLLPHLHDKRCSYLIQEEGENNISLLIYKL